MTGRRTNLLPMAALCFAAMLSVAAAEDAPPLHTNEAEIAALGAQHTLAVDDPMAVFAYVLGSLPGRVTVYPTENHYYFWFVLNGTRYAGNIKVDARYRAEGKIVFSYYEDRPPWLSDKDGPALILGPEQGVTVEKLEALAYRVTYKAKSVVFALNDLSMVKPPAAALAPDDRFIGPVFDESGIRFFMLFNARLKIFHFVLDETIALNDLLEPAAVGDGRIVIGTRTGFAFYRDPQRERKILIGVYRPNVLANNYFDGPFDQMPDNFIEGDAYRDAIVAAEPRMKGKINRYGSLKDDSRFAAAPYMEYDDPKDLAVFDRCARSPRVPADRLAACFALPLEAKHDGKARPLALERAR